MLFESVFQNKKALTYSRHIYSSTEIFNKRTGYNFFDLFINSYLNTIIKGMRNEKKISNGTYRREKNKFFSDFLFFWYKKIRIKKDSTIDINYTGMETSIFKTYKFSPIFYLYLLYLPFYLIGFYFKKLLRSMKSSESVPFFKSLPQSYPFSCC
jgi:hypothetical protein